MLRRARREALEAARLNRPLVIVLTIGWPVIAALAVFFWTHDLSSGERALWTIATAAGALAIAFTAKLVTVPPAMAAEAENRVLELASQLEAMRPQRPDCTLRQAVAYIVTGDWAAPSVADITTVSPLLEDIRRRAHDRELDIWGRLHATSLPAKVPPDVWRDTGIDVQRYWVDYETGSACTERIGEGGRNVAYRYLDLELARAQVELQWEPSRRSSPSEVSA